MPGRVPIPNKANIGYGSGPSKPSIWFARLKYRTPASEDVRLHQKFCYLIVFAI